MHRLATIPGGWNPQAEETIFVGQTPAPFVLLTAADTDIQTVAAALTRLPDTFPALRVANLLQLQQQIAIDTYAETVLSQANAIVLRILGGRSYWSYGLEVTKEIVQQTGASLIVIPGDDRPDPDLIGHSNVPLAAVNRIWHYFVEGGVDNITNALKFITNLGLNCSYTVELPTLVPRVGLALGMTENADAASLATLSQHVSPKPKVAILFYRAHYLAGNIAPIAALCQALAQHNLEPIPLFVSSLRDRDVQSDLQSYLQPIDGDPDDEAIQLTHSNAVKLILNTTGFAISQGGDTSQLPGFPDVPVLQVILSSSSVQQWQAQSLGLLPRDMAMNVALPEVDGRIISRAISFKAEQVWNDRLETSVVTYQSTPDRVGFVAELAANWVKLHQTPPPDRKIALILANYPNKDGRLANGVGLDTPASCIEILQALQQNGYRVAEIPETGDALIDRLTSGVTNDPEGWEYRPIYQSLSASDYQAYFNTLPEDNQAKIIQRWGNCPQHSIQISGIQLGNIFIGIQPSRGYDRDPSLNYHAPDLEPTHDYLAFYHWLRQHFQMHAIVHVGKHGNLEWLPGKSVALSEKCYPEIALGAMPHFYPFIVNDPGEGAQAKRRSQAVILDHLTPPMTRAELYGGLQQLEGLIDEYYQAQSLNPARLPDICDRLQELMKSENLHHDLSLVQLKKIEPQLPSPTDTQAPNNSLLKTASTIALETEAIIPAIDSYLCELKEAQIRDGLHIFGRCPQGIQLRDLIVAIARSADTQRQGLTRAIAADFQLDFDPLTAEPALALTSRFKNCYTIGDAIAQLEQIAAEFVEQILQSGTLPDLSNFPKTSQELTWIRDRLLPKLQQTDREIINLLRGLDGRFVPSGSSGAPTRGRADVLPTGRNFYSVDIRAIPTETAWRVGRIAAELVIDRYTQEHGEYPQTLALSIWGTSTMRTGGDDIAEALALIGVQPVWDGPSRRVIDFEILPLSHLGRPRIDVTLRISGFFRDAFPNLIDLFDSAVTAVARLDEPPDLNPLADRVRQETLEWQQAGLDTAQAQRRSLYRIFGSKPGAYGAGLQGLIEAQNWTDDRDLAQAYINWSSYAYAAEDVALSGDPGKSAPEAFERRLANLQIVLHNQDNREHDLLDSDDYYQFQGGLTAAVRVVRGQNPATYFGDRSRPEAPKVRRLQEEIARVYRSRVVNPKWIAGVMRHGYKGAFEMAATVDYLFAYDATAQCVEDYMYQGVADAYLFDRNVEDFIRQKNPWALRDMAERLLEAHQRGLWGVVDAETLDRLRAIVLDAEGEVENK
jgi:cobaltochelatase CobN